MTMQLIAAEQADLAATIANNGPILIAVVGIIGAVIAAKVIKPPTYSELVTESRNLRADRAVADEAKAAAEAMVSSLRADFEAFKAERTAERAADHRRIGILSDGIDAMWSYIHVLRDALKVAGRDVPEPSEYVEQMMESARQARIAD